MAPSGSRKGGSLTGLHHQSRTSVSAARITELAHLYALQTMQIPYFSFFVFIPYLLPNPP